ncbi:MAG: hypothetical protein HKN03_19210 [Acidimicrobiales bacterium]|nr:hypothetical protein [Acidimicrobiales bacterium]
MNGRCQNDLMDYAADICDSCGDQFCEKCLVHPRGPKGPPFCTNCAMALSGVRNRRPVKPIGRGEIKRRRKALRAELNEQDSGQAISMPGTDLINGPELERQAELDQEKDSGIMSRFRRRKTDRPAEQQSDPGELFADDEAVFETTVAGGRRATDPELGENEPPVFPDTPDEFQSSSHNDHSSATALLNQLREGDGGIDEDVWLPAADQSSAAWSLPEMPQQSPLGASGPWGAVASAPVAPSTDAAAEPVPTPEPFSESDAPMFVTEAELKAQGPKDIDTSGNWVPPILRGMAPSAGSNGAELTRRRRRPEPTEQPPETES